MELPNIKEIAPSKSGYPVKDYRLNPSDYPVKTIEINLSDGFLSSAISRGWEKSKNGR